MLEDRPRADMPGFQANPVDLAREKRYAVRRDIELRNRTALLNGQKLYDYQQPPTPHVPFPAMPVSITASARPPVIQPPKDYPLHPRQARVTDKRETVYVWRPDCGNDIFDDHTVSGGWEDPADSRNFLGYGRASVNGQWRRGLISLAFPDGNCLRATWSLKPMV